MIVITELGKTMVVAATMNDGAVTASAIMRLLRRCALGGEIGFAGQNLLTVPAAEMAAIRGRQIAMIF